MFLPWLAKCFEVSENVQKFKFKRNFAGLVTKFGCSDNPEQDIGHKVKKSSKIVQDLKNLLSNVAYFWTAIVKV